MKKKLIKLIIFQQRIKESGCCRLLFRVEVLTYNRFSFYLFLKGISFCNEQKHQAFIITIVTSINFQCFFLRIILWFDNTIKCRNFSTFPHSLFT